LNELWKHYEKNWSLVSRSLNIPPSTLKMWRNAGFIPITAQIKLEERSNGAFKANLKDVLP